MRISVWISAFHLTSLITPRLPEMGAHGLEQARGTCTFDFKPLGSGLLGKVFRQSLISSYFQL